MRLSIVSRMRGCRELGRRWMRARGRCVAVVLALLLSAGSAGAQASASTQPRPDTALATLRAQNAWLAARVDSLSAGLREHRTGEGYFNSALATQTTLFSIIVTVVVALFGTATWREFRRDVRRSVDDSRRVVRDALVRVRRLNKDQRSSMAAIVAQVRHMDESHQKAVSDAIATLHRVDEELRATMRDTLFTQREESEAWNARLGEAQRFTRRAAANAYVAIASVHGPGSRGRTIAAHLLAAGNFYAAGSEGRNEQIGAANLEAARRVLNGIQQIDRPKVAEQLVRETTRVEEALELLRVHAGREADGIVAEIRVRLQEFSRTIAPDAQSAPRAPGEPSFSG